jgi:hypothetical protein
MPVTDILSPVEGPIKTAKRDEKKTPHNNCGSFCDSGAYDNADAI